MRLAKLIEGQIGVVLVREECGSKGQGSEITNPKQSDCVGVTPVPAGRQGVTECAFIGCERRVARKSQVSSTPFDCAQGRQVSK